MSKIYFQGTFGAYSHLAALSVDKKAEIIPCKTFDECFLKASTDSNSKIIIPESNRITGNIGIEYLIFKYRLNIYSEYFQKIEHNLLGLPGTRISEIKNVSQPEFGKKKYITSFLFKLKSKPAALYQSLGGFAINGVNLTKLQSYPEKNSFDSFFFLCDLDGHIEDQKVQKSLEELGLHCQDFHVLGVFEADKQREK